MRRIFLILVLFGWLLSFKASAVGGHRINLVWTPVTTYTNGNPLGMSDAYMVYKSADGTNFVLVQADIALTTTGWTDQNVVPGKTYFYYITVYDSQYNTESTPSPIVTAVTP